MATIKEIIRFFRESPLRRKFVPNVPMFCETRWSQKYRSIAIFREHYVEIVAALKSSQQMVMQLREKLLFKCTVLLQIPSLLCLLNSKIFCIVATSCKCFAVKKFGLITMYESYKKNYRPFKNTPGKC